MPTKTKKKIKTTIFIFLVILFFQMYRPTNQYGFKFSENVQSLFSADEKSEIALFHLQSKKCTTKHKKCLKMTVVSDF